MFEGAKTKNFYSLGSSLGDLARIYREIAERIESLPSEEHVVHRNLFSSELPGVWIITPAEIPGFCAWLREGAAVAEGLESGRIAPDGM